MKISGERLVQRLQAALGAEGLNTQPDVLAQHCIAGRLPTLLCLPRSAEQIAAALRVCAEADANVGPWGGGTAMAIGNPPLGLEVVISLSRMNRLIEHDHANLTVTAQCGITLGALQTALHSRKQFAPVEAPFPERSTLGGVIATNINGPKRSSHGSLRDLVIGLKIVLGTGEQIKTGGKVVKNVAGYDLCKLFTGSLGSLGIITEATVRVAPDPEESATHIVRGPLAQTLQLAHELEYLKLLPAAVFLRSTGADKNWQLVIGFEGFGETIRRQSNELDALAERNGMTIDIYRGPTERGVWRDIGDLPLAADRVIYRMTVPRSSVTAVLGAFQSLILGAATVGADLLMGTIWILTPVAQSSVSHFARLASIAQEYHGHVVMFAAPPELKRGIEVWGPSPPTIALMRDIKQRFDPNGIMNPGRFIGGL